MAATKEEIKELAEHIYDLDAEVYVHLGSSLGRVFNRDRERCVNELTELLTTRPQGHLVRSELGLIANMARTIEDKEERAMCMTEYNRILNEVMSLPTSFASGDVIDPILAKLNSFNVANRFSNDDHLIICISWTYGSGGIDVGFKLADKLHINYYDADIFEAVLKRLDAEKDKTIRDAAGYAHVSEELQQSPASEFEAVTHMSLRDHIKYFSRYHGLSRQDLQPERPDLRYGEERGLHYHGPLCRCDLNEQRHSAYQHLHYCTDRAEDPARDRGKLRIRPEKSAPFPEKT